MTNMQDGMKSKRIIYMIIAIIALIAIIYAVARSQGDGRKARSRQKLRSKLIALMK